MKKEEFESIGIELVINLGKYVTSKRNDMQVKTKPDSSFVTDIDLELERRIKKEFVNYFPNLSFLGEEFGLEKKYGRYTLIIDPIDGTESFIKKGKDYAINIALEDSIKNEMLYGIIYDVAEKILYVNERRISNKPILIRENVVVQGSPNIDLKAQFLFQKRGVFIKGSSTALNMARALYDEYEIFMSDSYNIKIWDFAPACAINSYLNKKKLTGIDGNTFDYKNPYKSGILIR